MASPAVGSVELTATATASVHAGVKTVGATSPAAAAAAGGADERPFREVYAERLQRDTAKLPPGSFPEVEVAYSGLSYTLQVPRAGNSGGGGGGGVTAVEGEA
jgi:hypothetical protein